MCGICGIAIRADQETRVERATLERMDQVIAHRGPDDEGYYLNHRQNVGMASRRLSIIDLPGGHMPVYNEDRTVSIVFNGEIYNYRALRAEMERLGHCFNTHSDTEVIVHLYETYGDECVQHLRGMFAFAIWDERQQKLLLARDRLGQKPLFYTQANGHLFFASEPKSILAAGHIEPELDPVSLHYYLSLRFVPPPRTMFKGIHKMPPAHILTLQDGRLNISQYWELSFNDKLRLPDDEYLEGLDHYLSDAVGSHLVSDVPVGAFLSGGMDSSMVVALMSKQGGLPQANGSPFKTFAIGVEEQSFNELPYARTVAEHFNTDHVEERVQSDLIRLLPRIVWHMDEPSDPIAACMFHSARLASHHVKVVMGGDGGDELFAGFDRYLGLRYLQHYARVPSLLRQHVIAPIVHALPENFAYKSVTQKLRWMEQLSAQPDSGRRYAEATAFFRFNHQEKEELFSPELWRQVRHLDAASVIVDQYHQPNAGHALDRMLYADFVTRLPEHSLMLTDRMTMAHGLEARSPFLDHHLVEFVARFPPRLKIRGRQLKYILRRLGEQYLPSSIVQREKQGFMFPIAYWFQNDLRSFVHNYLSDAHVVNNGLFHKEKVLQLLQEHTQQRRDNHVRLWMLLNIEVWHQLYIQQKSLDEVRERLECHL